MATPAPAGTSSRVPVRYRVVAFTVSLAALTYLDRVCIGVLAPSIMKEFNLTQLQMSYVFSAFTLSYGLFEIPTAWWADRIGSRAVVARIVTWWSLFTVATAGAFNYASLLVVRFLFGVGEAGAWPNAARVFSRWVPAGERGMVQGIFFAGAHLSGGLTPSLVLLMAGFLPWRAVFVIFGSLGFFWALAWYRWYRDEPSEHPSITKAEAEKIVAERRLPASHGEHGGSWGKIFGHPSLLPICMMYFANTYGFFFLISWLPTYLQKARGFSQAELGLYSGLPLLLSVVADLFGGATTDRLTRRLGVRWGRCSVGASGYLIAAIAMVAAAAIPQNRPAAIMLALATAASMFTLAPSWATCIDIGGRHSAVLSAAMNTSGQVGGFLSPIVLAYLVDRYSDWSLPLYVLAGLYLQAAVCWLLIRPDKPIKD